jgi:hypothetical protein
MAYLLMLALKELSAGLAAKDGASTTAEHRMAAFIQ